MVKKKATTKKVKKKKTKKVSLKKKVNELHIHMQDKKDELVGKYQAVVMKFSDGTIGRFTGPAVVKPGGKMNIIDIRFTTPKTLPANFQFGTMEENKKSETKKKGS